MPDFLRALSSQLRVPTVDQNMGLMDRIVRAAIGGALLMNYLNETTGAPEKTQKKEISAWTRFSGLLGGAFVIYGLTGWDPLFSLLKTSSHPGDEHNMANLGKEWMASVKSRANGLHPIDAIREIASRN